MTRITLALLLAVITASSQAMAADWPYWRGPSLDGVSAETGLPDEWSLKDGKNVLWESPVGGRAAPVILNGKIYINTRTPEDLNDPEERIHGRERVVCIDLETGETLWEDRFNVSQTDISTSRIGWAAMSADPETGYVYAHTVSGYFKCYTADGEIVWEHSLLEEYGEVAGYGGRTQSPIVDEDRVIVGLLSVNWGLTKGPSPQHCFYAFDKKTGELQWVSAPGGAPDDTTYSNPIIRVINGQRQLIAGNGDGGIYAINARTGEKIWGFAMSKRGVNISPVVDGDLVYMAHGEDNIDTTKFGRVQCIDATGTGDVTATHGVWRVDGIKAGYTGLLVKDGILYVVGDVGDMFAYDSKTGEHLWTHNLGTVGKGSPIWADGKIYVMEVNGNIHILKPSREGCETLSHVTLDAVEGGGKDEIYGSPAVSDGKVVLVTRDRMICLYDESKEHAVGEHTQIGDEGEADSEIALVQLRPFEMTLKPGDSVDYVLKAFDSKGRFIKDIEPTLAADEALAAMDVSGARLAVPEEIEGQAAGYLTAKHEDMEAQARIRAFGDLPWEWNFDGMVFPKVPPAWIRAHVKLKGTELEDGNVAMKAGPGPGRPSHAIWMGPFDMKDYVVQADVMLKDQKFRMPDIGITVNRYDFVLRGNVQKLVVRSWAPELRMAKEIDFQSDPDVWYTMKLQVDVEDDGAHVRGKIWKRDGDEPEEWTIDAFDPHAQVRGAPGLYFYALAECYFDNVKVTPKK